MSLMLDIATRIHSDFVSGNLREVVFTDFAPANNPGFVPRFAPQFNCKAGSEDVVRDALEYLEQMGALDIDPEPIRSATTDRKEYPAELRVRVTLRH